jgi:predicted peptidase
MTFFIYFPPGYRGADATVDHSTGWPLLLFLHSMHGRLDGDNNLFYESDTPIRLLLGDERCPPSLRDDFIVIAPQCPNDVERGDHAGVWLRKGWYETSSYSSEMELALASLILLVCRTCHIDSHRIALTGTSMGAYACLELSARWPGVFSAVAPVAAHYDLDPIDQLVQKLTEREHPPFWFFHAKNDEMCPFEPIKDLVDRLRNASKNEAHLTAFDDTWSRNGHCADRVAYWYDQARFSADKRLHCTSYQQNPRWQGEDLFTWLKQQRGPGRLWAAEQCVDRVHK